MPNRARIWRERLVIDDQSPLRGDGGSALPMNLPFLLAPIGRTTTSVSACPPTAESDLGVPRQLLMANALSQAQRVAESTQDLRLDLPSPGRMRIRDLVHRGAPRPVFKTTSIKIGRVVQCESALEHEAALLLDISPAVQAFAEQPVRIRYRIEDVWTSHIPDFVALVSGRLMFVEIKFGKDVDAAVSERTRLLEKQLLILNGEYCLLTERQLRQGDHAQNAIRVLRRARHAISEAQLLATLEKLRTLGRIPLAAFGWSVAESIEAVGIAKLIMSGHAAIDSQGLLTDRSWVWFAADPACTEESA